MLDFFSPPVSSALRTRPRIAAGPGQRRPSPLDMDLAATVTTSVDEQTPAPRFACVPAGAAAPGRDDGRQRPMDYAYETPPTVYTPHAAGDDAERMAASASLRRQYRGLVVHVPKRRDSGDEEMLQARRAPSAEEELGPAGQPRAAIASAPARLPVSTLVLYLTVEYYLENFMIWNLELSFFK